MAFEFPRPGLPVAEGGRAPMAREWLRWLRDLVQTAVADAASLATHVAAAATTAHTAGVGTHAHAATVAAGGQLDHGAAMTAASLADDDHGGYLWLGGRVGGQNVTGRVGFAVAAPEAIVHVADDGSETLMRLDKYSATAGTGAIFRGFRSRGSIAVPAAVQANDCLAGLRGFGYHSGGAFSGAAGNVEVYAAEGFTSGAQGTYAVVKTTPIGGTTPVERVRVADDGAVLISDLTASRAVLTNATKELVSAAAPTSNALSGDVTMTNANEFYAGPALTLGAGKWMLVGQVDVLAAGTAGQVTVKLEDGTTCYASAGTQVTASTERQIPISAPVTLTGSTTLTVRVASTIAAYTIKASPVNNAGAGITGSTMACGNTASMLSAIQVG